MTLRHDAMTCQNDVIILRKMEISIYTFNTIGNYGKLNKTWVVSLEQGNSMMTWRDSWQYVITWHTWHDVKAWRHKHKVGYLTSSICRCRWTGAIILLLFRTVFRSRDTFQLTPFCVTFTRDLETEGHVMVYLTFYLCSYLSYSDEFVVVS